jgi:hypothetical protein
LSSFDVDQSGNGHSAVVSLREEISNLPGTTQMGDPLHIEGQLSRHTD